MANMHTIREVAQKAGVSPTTVSHVINNTRFVSEATRQRVLHSMAVLGYQPNALARSLRRGSTNTIGLILPDSANPFYAEIGRAMASAAFQEGYFILLCNTDDDPEKEREYLNLLAEKRVDGIILLSAGVHYVDALASMLEQGMPIVGVDRALVSVPIDCVTANNTHGGYLATRCLVEHGHHRIACIAGPQQHEPSNDRVSGYRQALLEAGLPYYPDLVANGNFRADTAYEIALEWLRKKNPPTAIFVCNDLMAIGVMRAAADAGKLIPRDVAIVGYDDIELASYTIPPLTTVSQPKDELGRITMDMLLQRIRGARTEPTLRILDPKLILRGTC